MIYCIRTYQKSFAAVLLLALFSFAPIARATNTTYKFCIQQHMEFTDSGAGVISDDEWGGTGFRYLANAYAEVGWSSVCGGAPTSLYWTGYLSDTGCTPTITMPVHSCIQVAAYSFGIPSGNSLQAFDGNGAWNGHVSLVSPANGSTTTIKLTDQNTFGLYTTVAHIMNSRFLGNLSNAAKNIHIYDSDVPATCGCAGTLAAPPPAPEFYGSRTCSPSNDQANICLVAADVHAKYLIAHEYGHANLGLLTPGINNNDDCSSGVNGGHDIGSLEYMGCAMLEGWAEFVAVDTWNDDDDGSNPDGYYYWPFAKQQCTRWNNPENIDQCPETPDNTSVVNAESDGCYDDCKVKFMETYEPSTVWSGRGVEVDWMRMFWDYHTNNPGLHGTPPGHDTMQSEIGAMTSINAYNFYDRYRLGVASYSGCSQYQRMVHYANLNGADHCDLTCDDVPACTDCDSTGCP